MFETSLEAAEKMVRKYEAIAEREELSEWQKTRLEEFKAQVEKYNSDEVYDCWCIDWDGGELFFEGESDCKSFIDDYALDGIDLGEPRKRQATGRWLGELDCWV